MAGADYKLCDVCGAKAFYDANLDYDNGRVGPCGEPLPGWCGDWAVLCEGCSTTYRCFVEHKAVAPTERAAATGCTGTGGSKLTDFFTDRELTEALIDLNQGVLLSMRDCTSLDAVQAEGTS